MDKSFNIVAKDTKKSQVYYAIINSSLNHEYTFIFKKESYNLIQIGRPSTLPLQYAKKYIGKNYRKQIRQIVIMTLKTL